MIRRSFVLASLIALCITCGPACGLAAQPAKSSAAKGLKACRKDISKYCKDVRPGEGRVGKCLFDRLNDLSKSCKKYAAHGGPGHEIESLGELDALLMK